jgi:hypothetical protein
LQRKYAPSSFSDPSSSRFPTSPPSAARSARSWSCGLTTARPGRSTHSKLQKTQFKKSCKKASMQMVTYNTANLITVIKLNCPALTFKLKWFFERRTNQSRWRITVKVLMISELSQLEDLNTNRITRILTTDFPQYFAIVSRIRQEVHAIGPEGITSILTLSLHFNIFKTQFNIKHKKFMYLWLDCFYYRW